MVKQTVAIFAWLETLAQKFDWGKKKKKKKERAHNEKGEKNVGTELHVRCANKNTNINSNSRPTLIH